MKKYLSSIAALLLCMSLSAQERLDFDAMFLCYGGSGHRVPSEWTQDRCEPLVTCKDASGQEQWLFDSFLMLEVWDLEMFCSYGFSWRGHSADKVAWTKFLDYWFEKGKGFHALDDAVDAAAQRIGNPPTKRTIVMSLPDPIIHKMFNDPESSTTYWGELDGRTLDFSNPEDRMAAMKWYVDQVVERFDAAQFKHLDLTGFYLLSEDLSLPDDGWSAELKHYEEIFPRFTDYIHSLDLGVLWIPYFQSPPYRQWRRLGIDVCIMQPNHYWDEVGRNSMELFFSLIDQYQMDMEIECDENILGSGHRAVMYKSRFRDYLRGARENGVYGSKRFAFFANNYAFQGLAASDDPLDQKLYKEICEFVINNPRRHSSFRTFTE